MPELRQSGLCLAKDILVFRTELSLAIRDFLILGKKLDEKNQLVSLVVAANVLRDWTSGATRRK